MDQDGRPKRAKRATVGSLAFDPRNYAPEDQEFLRKQQVITHRERGKERQNDRAKSSSDRGTASRTAQASTYPEQVNAPPAAPYDPARQRQLTMPPVLLNPLAQGPGTSRFGLPGYQESYEAGSRVAAAHGSSGSNMTNLVAEREIYKNNGEAGAISYFIERILACKRMTTKEWRVFLSQPQFQTHELNRGSVWIISDSDWYGDDNTEYDEEDPLEDYETSRDPAHKDYDMSNKGKNDSKIIEKFYVKWMGMSHMHCSWELEEDLVNPELVGVKWGVPSQRYVVSTGAANASQNVNMSTFFPKQHVEMFKAMMTSGGRLYFDLRKGEYYPPEYRQIERVLDFINKIPLAEQMEAATESAVIRQGGDTRESLFSKPVSNVHGINCAITVKWRGLPYEFSTFEEISDLQACNISYVDCLRTYLAAEGRSPARTIPVQNFDITSPTVYVDMRAEAADAGANSTVEEKPGIYSSIRTAYDVGASSMRPVRLQNVFPCGNRLLKHQLDAVQILLQQWACKKSSIFADETGLGRNVTIAALLHMMRGITPAFTGAPILVLGSPNRLEDLSYELQSWSNINPVLYGIETKGGRGGVSRKEDNKKICRDHEFFFTNTRKGQTAPPPGFKSECILTTMDVAFCDEFLRKVHWCAVIIFHEPARHELNHFKLERFHQIFTSVRWWLLCATRPVNYVRATVRTRNNSIIGKESLADNLPPKAYLLPTEMLFLLQFLDKVFFHSQYFVDNWLQYHQEVGKCIVSRNWEDAHPSGEATQPESLNRLRFSIEKVDIIMSDEQCKASVSAIIGQSDALKGSRVTTTGSHLYFADNVLRPEGQDALDSTTRLLRLICLDSRCGQSLDAEEKALQCSSLSVKSTKDRLDELCKYSGKFVFLRKFVESFTHEKNPRLVILTQFRQVMDSLEEFLTLCNCSIYRADSSQLNAERFSNVYSFGKNAEPSSTRPALKVLLLGAKFNGTPCSSSLATSLLKVTTYIHFDGLTDGYPVQERKFIRTIMNLHAGIYQGNATYPLLNGSVSLPNIKIYRLICKDSIEEQLWVQGGFKTGTAALILGVNSDVVKERYLRHRFGVDPRLCVGIDKPDVDFYSWPSHPDHVELLMRRTALIYIRNLHERHSGAVNYSTFEQKPLESMISFGQSSTLHKRDREHEADDKSKEEKTEVTTHIPDLESLTATTFWSLYFDQQSNRDVFNIMKEELRKDALKAFAIEFASDNNEMAVEDHVAKETKIPINSKVSKASKSHKKMAAAVVEPIEASDWGSLPGTQPKLVFSAVTGQAIFPEFDSDTANQTSAKIVSRNGKLCKPNIFKVCLDLNRRAHDFSLRSQGVALNRAQTSRKVSRVCSTMGTQTTALIVSSEDKNHMRVNPLCYTGEDIAEASDREMTTIGSMMLNLHFFLPDQPHIVNTADATGLAVLSSRETTTVKVGSTDKDLEVKSNDKNAPENIKNLPLYAKEVSDVFKLISLQDALICPDEAEAASTGPNMTLVDTDLPFGAVLDEMDQHAVAYERKISDLEYRDQVYFRDPSLALSSKKGKLPANSFFKSHQDISATGELDTGNHKKPSHHQVATYLSFRDSTALAKSALSAEQSAAMAAAYQSSGTSAVVQNYLPVPDSISKDSNVPDNVPKGFRVVLKPGEPITAACRDTLIAAFAACGLGKWDLVRTWLEAEEVKYDSMGIGIENIAVIFTDKTLSCEAHQLVIGIVHVLTLADISDIDSDAEEKKRKRLIAKTSYDFSRFLELLQLSPVVRYVLSNCFSHKPSPSLSVRHGAFPAWDAESLALNDKESVFSNWGWDQEWETGFDKAEGASSAITDTCRENTQAAARYVQAMHSKIDPLYRSEEFFKRMSEAMSAIANNPNTFAANKSKHRFKDVSYAPANAGLHIPTEPITHTRVFDQTSSDPSVNPTVGALLLDRFDRLLEVSLIMKLHSVRHESSNGFVPSFLLQLLLQNAEVLCGGRLQLGCCLSGLEQDFAVLSCANICGWPKETTATITGGNLVPSSEYKHDDSNKKHSYRTFYFGLCVNDFHSRSNLAMKRPFFETNWGSLTEVWWENPSIEMNSDPDRLDTVSCWTAPTHESILASDMFRVSLVDLSRRLRYVVRVLMNALLAHKLCSKLSRTTNPSLRNSLMFYLGSLVGDMNALTTKREFHGTAITKKTEYMSYDFAEVLNRRNYLDVWSPDTVMGRIINGLKRYGHPRKIYEFVNPSCAANISLRRFAEKIGLHMSNMHVLLLALTHIGTALQKRNSTVLRYDAPGQLPTTGAVSQQEEAKPTLKEMPSLKEAQVLLPSSPSKGKRGKKAEKAEPCLVEIDTPSDAETYAYLLDKKDTSLFPSRLMVDTHSIYKPSSMAENCFAAGPAAVLEGVSIETDNDLKGAYTTREKCLLQSPFLLGEREASLLAIIDIMDAIRLCVMCARIPPALHALSVTAAQMPSWWTSEHSLALLVGICRHGWLQWDKILADTSLNFPPVDKSISPVMPIESFLAVNLSATQLESLCRVASTSYVEILLNWSTVDVENLPVDAVPAIESANAKTSARSNISKLCAPPPSAVEVMQFYMRNRRLPTRKDIQE